jgi:hypothetical protein
MTSMRMASRGGKDEGGTSQNNKRIFMGARAICWIKYSIPFQKFTVFQEKFLQKAKAENEFVGLPKKRSMTIEISMRNTMSSSDMI